MGFPALVFDILQAKIISDAEASGATDYELDLETRTWEEIAFWFISTWGLTFIIGLVNLSEVLMPVGAFWIEHVLSNLMLPAYWRSFYLLFKLAVLEQDQEYWWKLLGWLFIEWIIYVFQVDYGTQAMNYLKYNDKYYNKVLRPSLFYILKWIEHTPRSDEDGYL